MNALHSTINKIIHKKFNNISLISKKVSEASNSVISHKLNTKRAIKYADKFYVNIPFYLFTGQRPPNFQNNYTYFQARLFPASTIRSISHRSLTGD